ncbi:MAG: malto-oligosyltrehalose trehalohydrolase [Inquilinaceae bacterium]
MTGPARFAHAMPFGAEVRADGSTRFRLWAPARKSVSVVLDAGGGERVAAMTPRDDGWFEHVDAAPAGTRYLYQFDDGMRVADPASRFQPDGVHGASQVVDPAAFSWRQPHWNGRPWTETVFYEAHVGTFDPDGTYDGVRRRLDHLTDLGITALELMPLAAFSGQRGWGYDGVLPFAPAAPYGSPDALKTLIDEAHGRGLMVFLDVVYNHFGPDGNYLHAYAPQVFTERHHTPWGAALNFDGPDSRPVRDFFIHNALYWLQEYRFDGLRLDAVHAIIDDSMPDVLTELAETVHNALGPKRQAHLVLENDDNAARYLDRAPGGQRHRYTAQWNDDFHHVAHVLLTGETNGYYGDYADDPVGLFARALTEGFVYQGQPSAHRDGAPRGEPSSHLPPTAFVTFIQNHDQVGNRAFGDRIAALADPAPMRALIAAWLLAPTIPMLFMGEEWGSRQPFQYFCDFDGDLAAAVRDGRRREFAGFPEFADPAVRDRIPDPNAPQTAERSRLDWKSLETADHRSWFDFYAALLDLRQRAVVPRLDWVAGGSGQLRRFGATALEIRWQLPDTGRLCLLTNLGDRPAEPIPPPPGDVLYATHEGLGAGDDDIALPPWATVWFLTGAGSRHE